MRKLFERMNQYLAARAFGAAQDDVEAAQSKMRFSLVLANVFAALILCTPLLVAAASVWLLWVGHGTVLGWILSAMLLGLAWVLTPRRPRNTQTTYQRDDLPEFFDVLDQVCADLDAPQIDGVHFMTDMNAYLFEYRPLFGSKRRILGIGLTYWYTLDRQERLALIAHEVGHMVNRDPGRSLVIGYAMQTIAAWAFWLQPNTEEYSAVPSSFGAVLVNTILELFGMLCEILWTLLHWSMMYHSQIAEYVADAKSAGVAGKRAVHKLLFTAILSDEAERATRGLRVYNKPKDGWIFDHIATEIRNTPDVRKAMRMSEAETQKSSVDQSHPPSVYRIAFVDHLPDASPRVILTQQQADAIDASIVPHKDRLGAEMLRRIEVY